MPRGAIDGSFHCAKRGEAELRPVDSTAPCETELANRTAGLEDRLLEHGSRGQAFVFKTDGSSTISRRCAHWMAPAGRGTVLFCAFLTSVFPSSSR